MILKGEAVINDFLNGWFERHDFDVVAQMGSDFSINLGDNTLYYTPFYNEDTEIIFREEILKDFPEFSNCDISVNVLIALFHEVGHYETENEWEDKDWERFYAWRERPDITEREYFRHPIEWRATEWACEYILEHAEEMSKLWQDLATLFEWFYEINQVEDC